MNDTPNVAIIGCGLVGQKRAAALLGARLKACFDVSRDRALALASSYGARAAESAEAALSSPDIDIAIIATPHKFLAPYAAIAAECGKHVLVEKPGARRKAELAPLETANTMVRFGFNHRYHRSVRKARQLVDSGAIGPMMCLRARYGHGGRPGYDREWRADRELSGGGELLDQGVHLIDLARWFLGDFAEIRAMLATYFWEMPVEDNSFLLLRTGAGQVASLHASWTEWKNTFSVEIYGRNGKIEMSGLGGSYGVERLALYSMTTDMGPPPTTVWEYPMADDSWQVEFAEFLDDIREGRDPSPGVADAMAVLEIVERAYAEEGR